VGYRLYILRRYVIPVVQPGVGSGAAVQRDTRPRAGAETHPARQLGVIGGRVPGGGHQLQEIVLQRRGQMQTPSTSRRARNKPPWLMRSGALRPGSVRFALLASSWA
jgi:hypothetical protein